MKNILFIPSIFAKDECFRTTIVSAPSIAIKSADRIDSKDETWKLRWSKGMPSLTTSAPNAALALRFDNVDCDLAIARLHNILGKIECFQEVGAWHRSWRGYWELHGFWNNSGILVAREINYGERFTSRAISDSDNGGYFAPVEEVNDHVLALAYVAEARALGKVEAY